MNRDQKRQKLMQEIKVRVKELKKLGFNLCDCASTITLFDDEMFKGKSFCELTKEQEELVKVDSL